MRVDIFGTEKCKVTFGLKYTYMQNFSNEWLSDQNTWAFIATNAVK